MRLRGGNGVLGFFVIHEKIHWHIKNLVLIPNRQCYTPPARRGLRQHTSHGSVRTPRQIHPDDSWIQSAARPTQFSLAGIYTRRSAEMSDTYLISAMFMGECLHHCETNIITLRSLRQSTIFNAKERGVLLFPAVYPCPNQSLMSCHV